MMPTLAFPDARILPRHDETEHAMHEMIALIKDFETAVIDATSVHRVIQLRERIAALTMILTELENYALRRADVLCQERR